MTVDGLLGDWGLDPDPDPALADWYPDTLDGTGFYAWGGVEEDDQTTWDGSSGGEWYDIEALYVALEIDDDTQYMSWCMVTSYAGVEPAYGAAGDPVGYRNNTYGTDVGYPYRRHPVLALDLNGSGAHADRSWEYGIIFAPGHDWQGTGGSPTGYGVGLDDVDHDGAGDNSTDATWDADDGVGAVAALGDGTGNADAPHLWSVGEAWRDAHPDEFGGGGAYTSDHHPVDFDVGSGSNHDLATGVIYGGRMAPDTSSDPYDGTNEADRYWEPTAGTQVPGTSWHWPQRDNYVWEGWVEFPSGGDYGFDFSSLSNNWSYHYSIWCGNNDTRGDGITYGGKFDGAPELGTWALLLCTGVFGGWLKRRRKDE